MPVGIQRLNAKKSQPNVHIVFIKPLKGPDENIAQDFLERIAAQCLPVMRDNHLSVMTLEEFEPNREFVGRNFNAGEVIQLVLKSPGSGRWLPFNYVQMVMMHELAHCKQMNHSRAFWAVRNQYATHMYGLWAKGYRGDGIWGRGASLSSGAWETNAVRPDEEVLPEHLCGGTYRSRRRRRKRKPELSYQERKERRILKKFGKNGVALGADEEAKVKLEKGKKVQAKPRVAGSARGRELRAAAALARFEQQQVKTEDVTLKDESETESGSDSDGYEEGDLSGTEDSKAAVDVNGDQIKDKQGMGMVRVCEDEDASDPLARGELDELRDVFRGHAIKREPSDDLGVGSSQSATMDMTVKGERSDIDIRQIPAHTSTVKSVNSHEDTAQLQKSSIKDEPIEPVTHIRKLPSPKTAPSTSKHQRPAAATEASNSRPVSAVAIDTRSCAMCSFSNAPYAVTCGACANVLNPASTRNSWRCGSEVCRDSLYVNSGDCGVCGICGERKQ